MRKIVYRGAKPSAVLLEDPTFPTSELSVTENGTYEPEEGDVGFSKVTVAVPIPEAITLNVTENGEYVAPAGKGYSSVTVETQPAVVVDPILDNNSWEVIRAVCEAGQAADYWSLGATKTDTGTDNIVRTFRICDMSGLYGKHAVFEQVNLEASVSWNTSSNVDGDGAANDYEISDMRSTALPAVLAKYSSELQGQLTNTTYKVAKNGTSATLLDLTDKLFLPAEREIFASRVYSRTEEWSALTRFALYALSENDNSAFRVKYGPDNLAKVYWERSPMFGYSDRACYVLNSGNANFDSTSNSARFAPCFSF